MALSQCSTRLNPRGRSILFSKTDDEAEAIWTARKTILWSILTLKNDPSDEFLSADTAVPISKLGVAVDAAKKKIKDSGLTGVCLGHVGDGKRIVPQLCHQDLSTD